MVRIVLGGSKKPILQQEALAIFETSVRARIRLEPEWIPRADNEIADYISRITDYDDWSLNPMVFKELDRLWGPHTIDRFADWCNNQVLRFNSVITVWMLKPLMHSHVTGAMIPTGGAPRCSWFPDY